MLADFSRLFEIQFSVRCFLPSLFLVLGSVFVHDLLLRSSELARLFSNTSNRIETLAGSVYVGFLAWACGVLISAIQPQLVRTLEGYGRFNPLHILRMLRKRKLRQFRLLRDQKNSLVEQVKRTGDARIDEMTQKQYDEISLKLSTQFPSEERKILPTSFGNSMKALEEYPEIMYGLDGVTGWTRLQSVIPTDYHAIISEQRLYRDFWVNLFFVFLLLLFETWLFLAIDLRRVAIAISLSLCLAAMMWWSHENANNAAQQFGEYVKSAFDLYINELGSKLRLPRSEDSKAQREIWTRVAQAYTYRRVDILDKVFEIESVKDVHRQGDIEIGIKNSDDSQQDSG
jgi:hypothetical protein